MSELKFRVRMRVDSVVPTDVLSRKSEAVFLSAYYNTKNVPGDNSYDANPPASVARLNILLPELLGKFSPGQQFYVEFKEIEKS